MFFFKKKEVVRTVGGIEKSVLDKIKKLPKKEGLASRFDIGNSLNRETVIEELNSGLNVKEDAIYNPLIFYVEDQETLDILAYLGAEIDINKYDFDELYLYKFSTFTFIKYWEDIKKYVMNPSYYTDISELVNPQIIDFLLSKNIKFDTLLRPSAFSSWRNVYDAIFNYIWLGDQSDKLLALDFLAKVKPNLSTLITEHFFEFDVEIPVRLLYFMRVFSVSNKNDIDKMLVRYDEVFGKIDFFETLNNNQNLYFLTKIISSSDQPKFVQYLMSNSVDPRIKNTSGYSFYDLILKNSKGHKKILAILNDGQKTESKQIKTTPRKNEITTTIVEQVPFKKRSRDDRKYDGVSFLELLQNDLIYFHEDEIIYDGEKHYVHKAWFNQTVANEYPQILTLGESISKQLIDFCQYVESNPKLRVEASKIGNGLLPHLYGENLTGILTINLFADHFLKVLRPNVDNKNSFMVMVESRFMADVPNYKDYLKEFLQTVINYNPLFDGEMSFMDMSFANFDIGTPKRKKRPVKKFVIESSMDLNDEIIKALAHEQDYMKFTTLAKKVDIKKLRLANNLSLLHLATILNMTDFALYLIRNGLDVNIVTTKRLTGDDTYVKSVNVSGVSALLIAAQEKNETLVEALIAAGADVNQANEYNVTPLMKAAQKNNVNIINMLIEKGARIDEVNSDGTTALSLALDESSNEAYDLLIKHGAKK